MRVRRVTIENFKRFESLDLDLQRLDCLVGANNSGKTTLLQALALFDFCVHHCLEKRNGSLELKRRTISPEDFYVLPVTNPMDIWHERRTMQGGKQRRVKILIEFESGDIVSATVKLDFNRFGISIESNDTSQEALVRLLELRIAYLPVFSMFLPREERRLQAALEDELVRGRVNNIIRNLILELKEKQRHDQFVTILRRSFPNLRDLRIQFDDVTDRYITVTYKEEGRPKEFDIFSAGSGFQQFLYLFGFILLRQPSVILLDEPDVHLHGSLQAVMLDELKRLVDDGKQVLFATHSRELITRVSPENILSLDADGASRLKVAFDVYDAMDRLGSIDPTQLATVQAFRRVVVVEDRSDRHLLSSFCSSVLGADVWQQVERRLAFCYSRGNPWKQQDLPRLQRMLQQMLTVGGQPLKVMCIADRDYLPEPETVEQRICGDNLSCHIWRRNEIENYLLNLDVLRRLLRDRDCEPTLFEQPLEQKFQELVESSRDAANDGLVQAFDELRKQNKENWNAAKMAKMAREFLDTHWDTDPLTYADAKSIVLPGIKRWLQDNGYGAFSDKKLAEEFTKEDLPLEMQTVATQLAEFAGVQI